MYTKKSLHQEVFPQRSFTHSNLYTGFLNTKGRFNLLTNKSFHTHKRIYTQKFLQIDVFRQKSQKLLHRGTFTRAEISTQKRVHTEVLTPTSLSTKEFYTQQLVYRGFHTERLLTHRHSYAQTRLDAEVFTQRIRLSSQELLHTTASTHRILYTQRGLHTENFTQRRLCTEELLHREGCYAKELLRTETFNTLTRLHTQGFAQKDFYTQKLLQSRAEVRAVFLDKSFAEKSPRPGHSRVTAMHQNTRELPSFD